MIPCWLHKSLSLLSVSCCHGWRHAGHVGSWLCARRLATQLKCKRCRHPGQEKDGSALVGSGISPKQMVQAVWEPAAGGVSGANDSSPDAVKSMGGWRWPKGGETEERKNPGTR